MFESELDKWLRVRRQVLNAEFDAWCEVGDYVRAYHVHQQLSVFDGTEAGDYSELKPKI